MDRSNKLRSPHVRASGFMGVRKWECGSRGEIDSGIFGAEISGNTVGGNDKVKCETTGIRSQQS